ncbi:hypothetical protein F511_30600 [Dorcoceras hygrometricum]|uniref:Uncharacterized protein n=1 Tax=Dorcoceras hygrometricum TaxID=472368 RepID=A0A2Z7AD92_9LAMI|nr:hypothetical protein F511_30600 [Dorcoceras hygrometricum]
MARNVDKAADVTEECGRDALVIPPKKTRDQIQARDPASSCEDIIGEIAAKVEASKHTIATLESHVLDELETSARYLIVRSELTLFDQTAQNRVFILNQYARVLLYSMLIQLRSTLD